MKRIAASVGLVVIGAASIQGVYGQTSLSGDNSKSWSVTAALRGFYDDNIGTTPSGGDKVHSFGFEVNPTIQYSLPALNQTELVLDYSYSFKYYDKTMPDTLDHDSQTHLVKVLVNHTFSERMRVSVQDSFVIGQEPDVLRTGTTPDATFQRISGNNIRNYGSITVNGQVTPLFGVEAGYDNQLWDYKNDEAFGAVLDRIEHAVHVDGRWNVQPDTVGLIGYKFALVNFTADKPIGDGLNSDARNSRSHYGYAGVEHNFRQDLSGSIQAGVRYEEDYNTPNKQTELAPYVKGALRYNYAQECYAELGVTYDRSATYRGPSPDSSNDITTGADATVVYGSLRHRLLPELFGSVIGQFQNSTFNGGTIDGKSEQFYTAGLNLEYIFNRHLSAEVGYNYDHYTSESSANIDYDRNRIYIGAKATY